MAWKKKKDGKEYFSEYSLWVIVLFLVSFGLVMIYSASSYTALQEHGEEGFFMKRQLGAVILGMAAMIVVSNVDYHFWRHFAVFGYVVSIVSLALVWSPLGVVSHNARRWFRIPGTSFQVQPAEIVKLCMILLLAEVIRIMGKNVSKLSGFLLILAIPVPFELVIWRGTQNLSSALILVAISALMLFVASPEYKKFVIAGGAVLLLAGGVVFYAWITKGEGSFRLGRIAAWLDPESMARDTGFQTLQGLYAIGSGGIWGKGLGQSMQKLKFLPESQNDMIFSIICEELGFFGAVAIIAMFIMLIWRMVVIASNAEDLFGAMLVVGVIAHVAVQAILNIAVVTNMIPNTGISLPFISYGGSSVLFLMIEMGLVLNVAKGIQLKEM